MIKILQAVTNIRQLVHSQVHIRPSNAGNVEKRMKRANALQRKLLVSTARNQITGSKSAERDLVKNIVQDSDSNESQDDQSDNEILYIKKKEPINHI